MNPIPSPGSRFGRRGLLAGAAGLGAATAVGCSPQPVDPSGGESSGTAITWWDHNVNLQQANGAAYDAYTADSGIEVDYTYVQTAKLGQHLQLAKQSDQLPSIHSAAGLELSIPALIDDGWFQPIVWDEEVTSRFGDHGLIEGLHSFGGDIYTFPIFAPKQYFAAQWFNKDFIGKAGVDQPPETYDEFRDACRKVMQANDGAAGFVCALGHTPRLQNQINAMAQAAGFEGSGGMLFSTGEYAYHDDAYVTVVEFMKSLQTDKLIFSGSSSLDDQTARTRWAAGISGYYMDGPWCSGTVQTELPEFLDKVDAGPMLRPDGVAELASYVGQKGGNYFISTSTDRQQECSDLLAQLVAPEYNVAIANAMAQPPFDLAAIDESDAIEPWKRLIASFQETVYIQPEPALKNRDIQQVQANTDPVQPGLGEIVQGVFSGDVTDVRGALKKLSDASTAAREKAIEKAVADGAEVSVDDYAFPDWEPMTDYDAGNYG